MNINRLLIIDTCLRDKSRKWSLSDLIEACAETESNSRRSVQADLELLRKSYAAPLVVVEKKYYIYKDERYTLLDQLLTRQDENYIISALDVIRSYTEFRQTKDIVPLLTDIRAAFHDALHPDEPAQYQKVPALSGKKSAAQSALLRLWVSELFAPRLMRYPINKTQRVEAMEIDGSVNIVVNVEVTHEFEYFLLMNDENIRVIEPLSLMNKIKKMKEK